MMAYKLHPTSPQMKQNMPWLFYKYYISAWGLFYIVFEIVKYEIVKLD